MRRQKLWYLTGAVLAAVFILGGLFIPTARAQDVQNFSFDSFSADYYLNREGNRSSKLDVVETLAARFPDYDQNHGILRAIPEQFEDHTLSLKILSVTDENGMVYHFTTSHQNHNLVLKIGDADKYVHGLKIYRIHYSMMDVIGFRAGHDEFFWDVNGDQWAQAFTTVSTNLHIPGPLQDAMSGTPACFTGSFGSLHQACTLSSQPEGTAGTVIRASAANVKAQETLSIKTDFKPGTFAKSPVVKRQELLRKISIATGVGLLLLLPSAAFIFMFRRWRQFGDDPKGRGVIIPEYEPPKGLDALSSDFLYKQSLRPTAVTATILELAVHGYLSITEIPKHGIFGSKDYELTLEKSPEQASAAVKDLLTTLGLLAPGTKVKLSELKKQQTQTYNAMKKLEEDLANTLFTSGYFLKDPKAVKTGYQIWAGILLAAAAAIGYVAFKFEVWFLIGLCFGLGAAAAAVFIYSFFMPARSAQGVDAYDGLLGLKDYIKLAEADRLNYLQSPEGAEKIQDKTAFNPQEPAAKIKLFEKLLPYAVLFGLEKDWTKQFNDIYTTPPGWYNGNWTTFNAAYLASSVGDFNSAGGQTFSTPSSSGSGGGAGGGGGGGGGGGW